MSENENTDTSSESKKKRGNGRTQSNERNKWAKLAPYPKPSAKQKRVVRIVERLANILTTITKIFSTIFKPITLLIGFFKTLFTKRKLNKRALAVPSNEKREPKEPMVFVANDTQAMDQKFYYILKNGRVWFKPIAAPEKSSWLLLGPDGLPPDGAKLTSISSDGVNIVAVDVNGVVNYVHSDKIDVTFSDDNWQLKSIKLDWTRRWLSIPIVGRIIGLIRGYNLKLPDDCNRFAISQKGPETAYYTDMSGKNQPEFLVGVTTLYSLSKNGRIYFADPWLPNEFRNEITAPEDGQFVAENIAAAASTVFLLRRDKDGKPIMYTRFADFDSIGSNPLLPASYNPDNTTPLVRHLPGEDWLKQPEIQLEDDAKLTGNIAILQTGRGQNNRQLRVEGTNSDGEPGYYYKAIHEEHWSFEQTPGVSLVDRQTSLERPPPPPVDFRALEFTTKMQLPLKNIELNKFLRHGLNERGLHTVVTITLTEGRKLELPLYAGRGLTHFLGRRNNSPNWLLVLPKKYRNDDNSEVKAIVNYLFKSKISLPVEVIEKSDGGIAFYTKDRKLNINFEPTLPDGSSKMLTEELGGSEPDKEVPSPLPSSGSILEKSDLSQESNSSPQCAEDISTSENSPNDRGMR